MPYYLIQTAYTPESWGKMIENPQDRVELVRPAIEGMGGRIEAGYISFGEYDFATIAEFPDNMSAPPFSTSASSAGGLKAFKTTPLLPRHASQQAMQKAGAR